MPHGAHHYSSSAGPQRNGFNGARVGLAALALSAAWSLPGLAYCSETLRTVALSGQPVPQLGAGVTFKSFERPSLSSGQGWTAFSAIIQGAGINHTNNTVILSEAGGAGLRMIAHEGDVPLASRPGFKYDDLLYSPTFAVDSGATAFNPWITDGASDFRKFVGRVLPNGDFELIAFQGETTPTVDPSLVVGAIAGMSPNRLGYVTISAQVIGDGIAPNSDGNWIESPNALSVPLYRGSATPLGPGITVRGMGAAFTNDSSAALTHTLLTGAGVNADNESALWKYNENGLSLVARGGDPAPGLPGRFFRNLSGRINNAGKVIFEAGLDNNRGGIWTDRGGSGLELVMHGGGQAPGAPAGVVFGQTHSLRFNDASQFAFMGLLEGPGVTQANGAGVYSDARGNGLEQIARAGDPAPGAGPGAVFARLDAPQWLLFNERGQVAFTSNLAGPGVDASNNAGIWAQDVNGNLQLIVRTGDLLDVSDDASNPDLRTVAFVQPFNASEWSLNDNGEFGFFARFTDGSQGLFVSSAVAVPEPASAIAPAFGLAAILVGRRPAARSKRILSLNGRASCR
jgi:hypothetical protein